MTVRVDPDLIEQLAGELQVVGRAIETTERELTTMVVQLLQEVEQEYPEQTVRAVLEEIRGLLRTVRTDAQALVTWYAQEARQLRTIVGRYRQTEAEVTRLARRSIPVISANRFAVDATRGASIQLARGSRLHAGFSKVNPVTNSQAGRPESATKSPSAGNGLHLPSGTDQWDANNPKRVQQLQHRLNQLGQSVLVNGTMDEQTKVAVKAYQQKYGIAPAGGVGTMDDQTWLALFGHITKSLKQGDRTYEVRIMQIRLKEVGYTVEETGQFDEQTTKAVKKFQTDHPMRHPDWVAGVMDKQTWQALLDSVKPIASDSVQERIRTFLSIAHGQLGFKEKNGNNMTPYGKWYGVDGQPWCAMFVSWCANESGILDTKESPKDKDGNVLAPYIPKFKQVVAGVEWYKNNERYKSRKSGYTPKAGDTIFFSSIRNGKRENHVGIVTAYDPKTKKVYTIEGNTSDSVAQRNYSLGDDYIQGYGVNGGTDEGTIPDKSSRGTGLRTR